MKKHVSLAIAAISLASVLAACGSLSDASVASQPDVQNGPTTSMPDDEFVDDEKPLGAGPYPIATLNVKVSHPEFADVDYVISCLGDTATITPDIGLSADHACLALAGADAQELLTQGQPADQICTQIFGGPDIAFISGEIDGQSVSVEIKRNDGCGIAAWDLLGSALPTSQGL
jgi:hypothetical protein